MARSIPLRVLAGAQDHLLCAVCLDVFAEPVSLACGHTFCRHCLAASLELAALCPTCRAPSPAGANVAKNIALAEAVAARRVHCRWHFREDWEVDPDGCPAELPHDAAAAHEARHDAGGGGGAVGVGGGTYSCACARRRSASTRG